MTKEVTLKKSDMHENQTVRGASELILKLDPTAEDYQFRMQAIIKRLVHMEKAYGLLASTTIPWR